MSVKKTGLNGELKVRLTSAEKDVLRRTALKTGVHMSVWCRSAIVDALTNEQQRRDDLMAYQKQLSLLTDHILRVRALINASIVHAHSEHVVAEISRTADALQSQLMGLETSDAE
jgi:hypothetical protein